jgi:hypothetical protein
MFYDEQRVMVEVEELMMVVKDNLPIDLVVMQMLEMTKLNKRNENEKEFYVKYRKERK